MNPFIYVAAVILTNESLFRHTNAQ